MAWLTPTDESSGTTASSPFVDLRRRAGVLRATFKGPGLNAREAQIIAEQINTALAGIGRGLRFLVLDFSNIHSMSSVGLGMCIDVRNSAERSRAKTIALGLNREMFELFRMMRVDRLFTLATGEEELNRILSAKR